MTKSSNFGLAIVVCGIVSAAACQSDSPTGPTEPEPQPVTLTGAWSGSVTGTFIATDTANTTLTETDGTVTGEWSTPMPATLVAFGAPANVNLSGPVTGTASGTTAELSFGFADIEVFRQYFAEGCALSVTVTSFTETTMEATWMTNPSCQPPVIDSGAMMLTRQ